LVEERVLRASRNHREVAVAVTMVSRRSQSDLLNQRGGRVGSLVEERVLRASRDHREVAVAVTMVSRRSQSDLLNQRGPCRWSRSAFYARLETTVRLLWR
jgi:hypothetical protein